MTLLDVLRNDLTTAMKARDELARTTLRAAIAAVEAKAKAGKTVVELSEADVLRVLIAETKTRRATAAEFEKVGAADRAARENAEADLLAAYLPKSLTEDELRALVTKTVAETGASSMRDMGRVVSAVKDAAPTADGKQVSDLVKAALV